MRGAIHVLPLYAFTFTFTFLPQHNLSFITTVQRYSVTYYQRRYGYINKFKNLPIHLAEYVSGRAMFEAVSRLPDHVKCIYSTVTDTILS